MHKKLMMIPSATCPCGEEDQTTNHLLQICIMHDQKRSAIWPTKTKLHQNLHSDVETNNSIKHTGEFEVRADN